MTRYSITLRTASGEHQFECGDEEMILDAAENHGVDDLQWGCRSGVCGSCVAKLISGSVDQNSQMAVDEEHVDRGYMVMCISTPCSDLVISADPEDDAKTQGR